jgi:disulfide bond formation protein DsbB
METLAALAVVLTPAAVVAGVLLVGAPARRWLRRRARAERLALGAALAVAATATAASLYLSEVVGFPPCLLCWIQRGAMYPLVPLFALALLLRRPRLARLSFPLPLAGLAVALYHITIQLQPSLEVVSCQADAPCSSRWVAVFGFVSIPWLAASAFLLILALLAAAAVASREPRDRARGAA